MAKNLRKDICGLHSTGALATKFKQERVRQCLPTELQYACLYWVYHIRKGRSKIQDDEQMYTFLREHLLHWLEALGLMGKVSDGILSLISLESMVTVSRVYPYVP